jgi:putative ABC transport system permease protein
MALRNLREHRVKTIIVASLIAIGMILLVLGNSIIDTGKVGIERAFVRSYSGHVLIGPPDARGGNPSYFAGLNMGPGTAEARVVRPYEEVYEYVKALPEVAAVNPQVYGSVFIELPDDYRALASSIGVDLGAYAAMFPDALEVVRGKMLEPGEEGIVLGIKVMDDMKRDAGFEPQIGDRLKLSMFGMSTRIKSVPLVGIVRFTSANPAMDDLGFVDVSTLRYLLGMVIGSTTQIEVAAEEQALLDVDLIAGLDAFFGDSAVVQEAAGGAAAGSTDLYGILGDTSRREELAKADAGAWHYILLRLNDGGQVRKVITSLNAAFRERGWDLRAVDWEGAAGFYVQFVRGAQLFFLILVVVISVVSVIIIMNTMVVSIIERTAEIGTMRALGAKRSYVRKVFLLESLTLAVIGGLAGLLFAGLAIGILHATGLPSPHIFFSMIFGGNVIHPVLSWGSALVALLTMVAVGLLASLVPTHMALRIQPVRAIQSTQE